MSQRQKHDIILIILIILFIVVAGMLLWVLLRPSPEDDAWARVQSSQTLVVGTSADYPPFEYYNDEFVLDGFDVALIREVGKRLNVNVEVRDMVFDSLGHSLQAEQIDVAISAISMTDERSQFVYFSDPYFVSEDGVLAKADSPIVISSLQMMAPYRVGVQEGSVFQTVIQSELIDSGLMPVGNLLVYKEADDALQGLQAGQIDLFYLDLQPAQTAVASGGVKLAGQAFFQQQMAIAMKDGETRLQEQINQVLETMQNEGRIAQLALDYMGILPGDIIPPPRPESTITPAPTFTPNPCVNGMQFIDDINLDDENMQAPPQMPPGTPFSKGWRVRNSGTCTWDSTYYLGFITGNVPAASMSGQPTPIQGSVPPGGEYDLWVDLVSPLVPGTYQGFWAMHTGANQQFGDRVWVGITVPGSATVTPMPTQTPSPNITFTVDRNQIVAGECVLFNWQVQGSVTAVYFYAQGQPWQPNQVPAQGSRTECPPVTTTYDLRVQWQNGTIEIKEIAVAVQPVVGAPIIDRFTLFPSDQIFAGQCVDITWQVSGDVNNVSITRDDVVINANGSVSGSMSDCPPGSGAMLYMITATGSGGSSRLQRALNVILPVTQPPPPTATPDVIPPRIDSFDVRPETIAVDGCVNVSWSVSGEASLIQLKRDGIVVLDRTGYHGLVQDCPPANGGETITYRIEASNPVGDIAFQDAPVFVEQPAQPDQPLVGTEWFLTEYWDGIAANVGVIPGKEATAVFDSNSLLSGTTGCNTYQANYSLSTGDGSISIAEPTTSTAYCTDPAGLMQQEALYLANLPLVTTYAISGGKLEMMAEDGRVILRYEAR